MFGRGYHETKTAARYADLVSYASLAVVRAELAAVGVLVEVRYW